MASKTDKPDYLAPFMKLSPCIYVQEPDLSAKETGNEDGEEYPPNIVIAFWMNAFSRSLVKYIAEYKRLAPKARIIFIRTSSTEFILRPTKRQQFARLAPAVDALRSLPQDSPVFLHMFSNGGVFATTHLLQAYQKTTGRPLRVSSMVIDSAPGTATLSASIKAFSYVLPKTRFLRLFAKVLLYAYLSSTYLLGKVVGKIFGIRDAVSVARQVINDRRIIRGPAPSSSSSSSSAQGTLPLPLQLPGRCYIYSDADELVSWRDVESHAADAEALGWVVRREKFRGSEHVCHMRADPGRYWAAVKMYLYLKSG